MPSKVRSVVAQFFGIALIADNPSSAAAFYSALMKGIAPLSDMLDDWGVACVIDKEGLGHITLADTIHDGNADALAFATRQSWMQLMKQIPKATRVPFPHRLLPDPQTLGFKPFEVTFRRYAFWTEAQAIVAELEVINGEAYTAICELRDKIDNHLASVSKHAGRIRNFKPLTLHVTLYYLPTRHIAKLALEHGLGEALSCCKLVDVPTMRLGSCRWYGFTDMLNSSFVPFPPEDQEVVCSRQALARIAAERGVSLDDHAALLAVCLEDSGTLADALPAIAADFRELLERLSQLDLLRLHVESVRAKSTWLRRDQQLRRSVSLLSRHPAAFPVLLDLLVHCTPHVDDGVPDSLAAWVDRFGLTLDRSELEKLSELVDPAGVETFLDYPYYTAVYDSSEVGSIEAERSLHPTVINCEALRAAARCVLKSTR